MKGEKSECKVVLNTGIDSVLRNRTAEEFARFILSAVPLEMVEELINREE